MVRVAVLVDSTVPAVVVQQMPWVHSIRDTFVRWWSVMNVRSARTVVDQIPSFLGAAVVVVVVDASCRNHQRSSDYRRKSKQHRTAADAEKVVMVA